MAKKVMSRSELLNADPKKFVTVETPIGDIRLQTLTLAETFESEAFVARHNIKVDEDKDGDSVKMDYDIAALGQMLVDDEGNQLAEDIKDGYEILTRMGAALVNHLAEAGRKLHQSTVILGKDAEKVIEEEAKNSSTPPITSSSSSQSASDELIPINS